MNMPVINIVDPSIHKNNEVKYLSIQISKSEFVYCISTLSKNILVFRSYKYTNALLFEDFLNQTESFLEQDSLLALSFDKIHLLYIDRKSTLIPNDFFKPESLKSFMEFNQPLDDLDELHYNNIDCINSKVVFAFSTYIAGILTDKFKKIEFFNQAKPLIELSDELSSFTKDDHVLINLNKEFFDIVIYSKGKLRLYNSFMYVNASDLIYYILFVCKQLNIDYTLSAFYIIGELCDRQDLIKELSVFIKNIQSPFLKEIAQGMIRIPNDLHLKYATLFKLL